MSSPLPCGNAFRDVEEHDVAEFLQADEMGERAADLAGADERDLFPGHESVLGFVARAFEVALFDTTNGRPSSEQKINGQGFAPVKKADQA